MGRKKRVPGIVSADPSQVEEAVTQNDNIPEALTAPSEPGVSTRRSLRNQQRIASQTQAIRDVKVAPQTKETVSTKVAAPTQGQETQRKRNFLKETVLKSPTKHGRKKQEGQEGTASALNRLINKRVSKSKAGGKKADRGSDDETWTPPSPVKSGKRGKTVVNPSFIAGGRLANEQISLQNAVAASTSSKVAQRFPQTGPMQTSSGTGKKGKHGMAMTQMPPPPPPPPLISIKTEPQENEPLNEPRKRGRKRKSDIIGEAHVPVSAAAVPQDARKRGRQSAATEGIKPRFPFCSFCLTKTPPNDYIINYMSCPSEYQRMRRMFVYIYKDLKFPFMPFDLERENVFDYCDLPLCDTCILLYKELYDSFAQIEHARDQLRIRVERMVHQIQFAEGNPQVGNQLNVIKNSPDPLMNKYCNFRRRFTVYRPGASRGDPSSSNLIPATIARIRVINPAPKRVSECQTIITIPPVAPPSVQAQSQPNSNNDSEQSASKTDKVAPTSSTVSNSATGSAPSCNSDKTGSISTTETSSPLNNTGNKLPTKNSGSSNNKEMINSNSPNKSLNTSSLSTQQTSTSTPVKPTAISIVANKTGVTITRPASNEVAASPESKKDSRVVQEKSVKPQPKGTPIQKQTVVPNNSAQPATAQQQSKPCSNTINANGKTEGSDTSAIPSIQLIQVKEEPVDPDADNCAAEDGDPFLADAIIPPNISDSDSRSQTASDKNCNQKEDGEGGGVGDQSDSDTSVVGYKHKKLRVLPVPAYTRPSTSTTAVSNKPSPREDTVNGAVQTSNCADSKESSTEST